MSEYTPDIDTHPALVEARWLARRLHDGSVATVAILGRPPDDGNPVEGIEGAHAFHWKDLLWDARRRQFVDADTLLRRLRAAGVDTARHLVFYGEPAQFGFYARWVFLRAGLARVSVLDGGLRAWQAQERPVVPLAAARVPAAHAGDALQEPARATGDVRIGRDHLLQRLGDATMQIVDVRTQDEYGGLRVGPTAASDHGAERAGHIPGARLFPFADLLDEHGRLRSADELRALAARAGLARDKETVVYCRLGHRSTLAAFALAELLDFPHVRVYDGSWTEWGSLVDAPIEH